MVETAEDQAKIAKVGQDYPGQKWEYKVVESNSIIHGAHKVEKFLNELGSEGWELVNPMPNDTTSQGWVRDVYYHFKRPKLVGIGQTDEE